MGNERPKYTPTPEAIQEMCAEIRKGWSEDEHRKRAGLIPADYEIPVVRIRVPRDE